MSIDYGRLIIFIVLIVYFAVKSIKYKQKSYVMGCLIGVYGITSALFILPSNREAIAGEFVNNIFVQVFNAILLFYIVKYLISGHKSKLEK